MLECKRCQTAVKFEEAKPDIDKHGLHFVCAKCKHRNVLKMLKLPGQIPAVAQFDS